MNVPTSSGRPVRWLISAIGVMSATVVRAAQLARTLQLRARRSRAPAARRRRPRAGRRRAGRCRRCRCRAGRSGAGSRSSARWSASAPTATAARRAASRRRASPARLGRRADLVPVVNQRFEHLTDLAQRTPAASDARRAVPPATIDDQPHRRLRRAAARTIGRKPSLMVTSGGPGALPRHLRPHERMARRRASASRRSR